MILSENGRLSMHFGPAVLAKHAVCFVNEFDKLDPSQQDALLEVMEEANVHMNKFAKLVKIPAPTTIVASANPRNNKWMDPTKIDLQEIPFSNLIINRFDIILVFRDIIGEEANREFADRKTEYDEGHFSEEPDYSFHQKFVEHARSIVPTITQQARSLLNEYYVKLREREDNFVFNTRTLESIHRISKGFARLNLSDVVNEKIAIDTIEFMNIMFSDFHNAIHMIPDPWTVTYNESIKVIQNQKEMGIEMIEAVKMACLHNDQASGYMRDNWEQKNNIRLRSVCDKIIETPSIERIKEHPVVVRWKKIIETPSIERIKEHPVVVRWKKRVGDVSDSGDSRLDTLCKTD
jgi:DNA replicative helicase MCM subunit Mcm2 (Cdc46/Mcm family)